MSNYRARSIIKQARKKTLASRATATSDAIAAIVSSGVIYRDEGLEAVIRKAYGLDND